MNTTNMNTTLSPAVSAYVNRALEIGHARNLLTAEDAEAFAQAIAESDEAEACGWAVGVAYDLGRRCRSFTPADLLELNSLREAAGW